MKNRILYLLTILITFSLIACGTFYYLSQQDQPMDIAHNTLAQAQVNIAPQTMSKFLRGNF